MDLPVLINVTEEGSQAARLVFSTAKELETKGHFNDERLLDISHLELEKATVLDDVPIMIVRFVCQHVHCVRDAKVCVLLIEFQCSLNFFVAIRI